ncbi:MAG: hypothetical protein GX254_07685 [Clostridiales bacterium]|nr:hypothetical protein [Clostridiales bacterium]
MKSEKIYPNISAYGVELGGMTRQEAEDALKATASNKYSGAAVKVSFPADITLTIEAEKAGLVIDAEKEALRLYSYGRGGSFITNTIDFISCFIIPKQLENDLISNLDEEYIKSQIAETTRLVNAMLLENALKIEEKRITIIKGASSILVDEEKILELIRDAFISGNYGTVEYVPSDEEPAEIDLNDLKKIIYVEPKNAEYDERFDVSDHVVGVSFDEKMAQRRLDTAGKGETVVIPLIFTEPEYTKEDLEAMLFRDLLSSKTTSLVANEIRSKNVELSAKAVDETVILPGEVFSFNDTVGQRTAEKGYGAAPAYLNGEVVQEIGGGICQVSSTIYYCTLYADLEIVYRTGHLYTAGYLPHGMDATVSWGGPDFKFRNNTEYPIKIKAWRSGSELTVELYGTKVNETYVRMEYVDSEIIPYEVQYKEDLSIAPGETKVAQYGSNGYKVNTYRYRYNGDGTLISKTHEAYSYYAPRHEIRLVAPGELPSPPGEEETDLSPPEPEPSESPEISEASSDGEPLPIETQ